MKQVLALALSLAAASAQASLTYYDSRAEFDQVASTTLVEDFEGVTATSAGFLSFSRNGITYTPVAPANNLVITGWNSTWTNFGANLDPFRGTVMTVSGPENIRVHFNAFHSALGFDAYLNGLGPGTVTVYSGSSVLGSIALPNPHGGGQIFIGITSDVLFDGFQWTTTSGGALNTAIDTIALGAVATPATPPESAVPEPGSLSLAVAGLLAAAGRRRIRRPGAAA